MESHGILTGHNSNHACPADGVEREGEGILWISKGR